MQAAKNEVLSTDPYFDSDYTYISFGSSFYREGVRAGVITIDIVLPILEDFFKSIDHSDFTYIFLTTLSERIIFSNVPENIYPEWNVEQGIGEGIPDRDLNGFFNPDDIMEFFSSDKFDPVLIEAGSPNFPWRLYGIVDQKELKRELSDSNRRNYFIFLSGWILLFSIFLFLSLFRKRTHQNRKLNSENRQLREEIEKREAAEFQLKYIAYHDQVTGLENLQAFYETTSPPLSEAENRYMIYIFLNNIKDLSLILERRLIDRLLKEFSEKLVNSCPEGTRVFRGTGFNFFAITQNEEAGQALILARTLKKQFKDTIKLHNTEVRLRLNIGVAPFRNAEKLEQVLIRAETILSDQNNKKTHYVSEYNHVQSEKKSFQLMLDAEMEKSGFLEELYVLYQPIVNIKHLLLGEWRD
ncbi:MAG: GGDEF domain-containing protein [Spirochaetales bacterium]|nr:GGDEF domain-containing protein [Spirochaetales bacterium]